MEKLYTTKEVAEILSCSKQQVRNLIDDSRLRAIDIGQNRHNFRVRARDLEGLLSDFYDPDL